MAQSSDLERRISFVWKADKPYLDKVQKSSEFSLLGSVWNLQLTYFYVPGTSVFSAYYGYRLFMHQGTDTKNLDDSLQFYVTTFIEDRNKRLHLDSCTKVLRTDQVLFEHSKSTISHQIRGFENYEKMNIFCLFRDLPSSAIKIERITLSTETDSDLPLASDQASSRPSKDTFRAEKSVQACMDVPPDLENLSSDFCKLLDQKIFPDVKLKCGDRITSVHKSILASRSEVFTAMFRNKMIESETGVVDVTDLDATVLDLLLKYVYSGKIPDLSDETASCLYAAGDKYAIHTLKKACSDWMIRNLSEENCLASLILADAHSDDSFKDDVVTFISQHLQVLRAPAWLKLDEEHPRVANIVYRKCFASNFVV